MQETKNRLQHVGILYVPKYSTKKAARPAPLLELAIRLIPYIGKLLPLFLGFGRYFHIQPARLVKKEQVPITRMVNNEVVTDYVTVDHYSCECSIKSSEQIHKEFMSEFDIKKKETLYSLTQVQDHMMQGYLRVLQKRITEAMPPLSADSVTTKIASASSCLGKYFLMSNDVTFVAIKGDKIPAQPATVGASLDDANANVVSWSVVRTKLDEVEEINLTLMGPKAGLVTGIKIPGTKYQEKPQPPSCIDSDTCVTFQLFLPLSRRNGALRPADYLVELVGHFGSAFLTLDPSCFVQAEGLTGRRRQIAELDIRELYTLAFTYSLFTDGRGVVPVAGDAKSGIDARVTSLDILLGCVNRFKHSANTVMTRKEFVTKVLARMDQVALQLKHTAAQLVHPLRFKTFKTLEQIQREWQAGEIEHSTDAIVESQAVLLATFTSMFEQLTLHSNVETHMLITKGIAAFAGFLVVFLSGIVLIATMPVLAPGVGLMALGVVSGSASLYAVSTLAKSLNTQYMHTLREWARSLGLPLSHIRNEAYSLEKAISEQYQRKFCNVTDHNIQEKWEEYFPCGSLSLVSRVNRDHCIRVLETIHAHYRMREILSQDVGLGVVGGGKTGKSTFLESMFGCKTNPHPKDRTLDLRTFRIHDNFFVVDFPHMNSAMEKLKECYSANHSLVHLIVVVLSASQGGDDDLCEGHVVEVSKRFAELGTEVLYCFNGADRLFGTKPKRSRGRRRSVDGTNGQKSIDAKVEEKCKTPSQQETKELLLKNAKSYGLDPAKCMMTAFELDGDMTNEAFWARIDELESLGIYHTRSIKNIWLRRVLKDIGMPPDHVNIICADDDTKDDTE
eukprot:g63210.t1